MGIGDLEVRRYTEEFQGWTLQVDKVFEPTHQAGRRLKGLPSTSCAMPDETNPQTTKKLSQKRRPDLLVFPAKAGIHALARRLEVSQQIYRAL